jgi:hypothetical protein
MIRKRYLFDQSHFFGNHGRERILSLLADLVDLLLQTLFELSEFIRYCLLFQLISIQPQASALDPKILCDSRILQE